MITTGTLIAFRCFSLPTSYQTTEIVYDAPYATIYTDSGDRFEDSKPKFEIFQSPVTKHWVLTLKSVPREDFRKAYELHTICHHSLDKRQICPAVLNWQWGSKAIMTCQFESM